MYDFDAMEAVDELIDEINEEYASESAEDFYDAIYEELCERVECGELTLEEAEAVNDLAHQKAVANSVLNAMKQEETKLKKCINTVKKNVNSENYDQAYLAVHDADKHLKELASMADDAESINLVTYADIIDYLDDSVSELDAIFAEEDMMLGNLTESVVTESVKIEFKALIKSNPAKALTALKQRFRKSSTKLDRSLRRYAKVLKKKATNSKKSIAEGTKKLQKKIKR